jgi:ribosomal protein L37AE/L43A
VALPEGPLEYAKESARRIRELESQTEQARAEFRQAVRALHFMGGSDREIAEALCVTQQQVGRIIAGPSEKRRWRLRRTERPNVVSCSFCGREQKQVSRLIGGPGVYICDLCASVGTGIARGARSSPDSLLRLADASEARCCSFCGKTLSDVAALIVGPTDVICSDCLDLCQDIVQEEHAPQE